MADLVLAETAEEARETPEPQSTKNESRDTEETSKLSTSSGTTTTTIPAATTSKTVAHDDANSKPTEKDTVAAAATTAKTDELDALKATPPTPTVKIDGAVSRSNAAEKSPVDAISTWSEEGCHVFMPNWGETSSTNVSLLGKEAFQR